VADPTSGDCELRVDGEVQWSTFTVATTYGSLVAPYLDRVRFEDDAGNTPRHRFRHLVLWDDQGSSFNSWLSELRDMALRPTADTAAADWPPPPAAAAGTCSTGSASRAPITSRVPPWVISTSTPWRTCRPMPRVSSWSSWE
jgi:hypothetical protein